MEVIKVLTKSLKSKKNKLTLESSLLICSELNSNYIVTNMAWVGHS